MVYYEDELISIEISTASAFLFFLLSLLLWIVPFGVSLLTPSCSLLTGPSNGVFEGKVVELMVDQCYGTDDEGEIAKRLYDVRLSCDMKRIYAPTLFQDRESQTILFDTTARVT